jgi:hypothetical protein
MQQIAFIGLTTDNPNSDITPSPYSIRYYTQQYAPMQTDTTIQIRLQVDGGANRSLTNKQEYLSRYQSTQTYNIYGVTKDEVALQCTGKDIYLGRQTMAIFSTYPAITALLQPKPSCHPLMLSYHTNICTQVGHSLLTSPVAEDM